MNNSNDNQVPEFDSDITKGKLYPELKEIFLDNIVLKEYDVSLSHNLNILNLDNIYFNKSDLCELLYKYKKRI